MSTMRCRQHADKEPLSILPSGARFACKGTSRSLGVRDFLKYWGTRTITTGHARGPLSKLSCTLVFLAVQVSPVSMIQ